jgi:hypothetical protein
MYDYLADKYERENPPRRIPLVFWVMLFAVIMIVALALAALTTKSARNAAIDSARFAPCIATGC